MPMYASRFATHMTRHDQSQLIALAGVTSVRDYVGPETQCHGTHDFPLSPHVRVVRCPHAARYLRAGYPVCGNCARRTQLEVVS